MLSGQCPCRQRASRHLPVWVISIEWGPSSVVVEAPFAFNFPLFGPSLAPAWRTSKLVLEPAAAASFSKAVSLQAVTLPDTWTKMFIKYNQNMIYTFVKQTLYNIGRSIFKFGYFTLYKFSTYATHKVCDGLQFCRLFLQKPTLPAQVAANLVWCLAASIYNNITWVPLAGTMFITKIILDGFKSYGRKVELTGFDESFNAITGFNGSGKSNILDAIVFVLGLSKLEMARCHTLTDLIYKNGQTGVTTASVTLELDNSDDKFKHTEYRGSKKIVVRREVRI